MDLIIPKPITKPLRDTIIEDTKTVKSESEFSGYLFIWPENCKLKLENTSLQPSAIIDRKYIQIPVENESVNVTISIDSHDSNIDNDVCRYYYDIYNSSSNYSLVSNVNYGFKVPKEGFNFEFNVTNETNPAYYILFNKLDTGDLTITILKNVLIKNHIFVH